MDFARCITRLVPNTPFCINNNSYDNIEWYDSNTSTKPTLAECQAAWQEILNEEPLRLLREKRNKLLLDTDKYTSIPDWPHANDTVKQAWLTYRQALRDLPTTASPQLDANGKLTNVTWPTPPS